MFKLCRLPSGSPCLFLGKLKIYLTKCYWGLDIDNLNAALYIDFLWLRIRYKKNYNGHFIY